jgi:hypothetical protein
MISQCRLTQGLFGGCILFAALVATASASAADAAIGSVAEPDQNRSQWRLAQHIEVAPRIEIPHFDVPHIEVAPTLEPMPRLDTPTLSPQPPLQSLSPSQTAPLTVPNPGLSVPRGSGGPPPGPPGRSTVHVVPACTVTSAGDDPSSSNCTYRYIYYGDLYRDLYSCSSGACYARKFLELERSPIVVVYPAEPAALAQAQSVLHAEMAQGIRAMGASLRQQVYNGTAGLPSISQISGLVQSALDAVDAIDLPVDESDDQRLRRLGLTPAMLGLANRAR